MPTPVAKIPPYDARHADRNGPVAIDRRSSATGLDQLATGFAEFTTAGSVGPDTIAYEETLYLLAGELTVSSGGDQIVGRAGDLITVEKGTTVMFTGTPGTRFLYSVVPGNWRDTAQ